MWAARYDSAFTNGYAEDLQVSIFPPEAYPLAATEEDLNKIMNGINESFLIAASPKTCL